MAKYYVMFVFQVKKNCETDFAKKNYKTIYT